MNYNEWVRFLPRLTSEQRADLASRLHVLDEVSEPSGKADDVGRYLVDAICEVLSGLGVEFPSPNVLRRSQIYKTLAPKLVDLQKFLDSVTKNRLEQKSLLERAIKLLYHDLLRWHTDISAYMLMKNIHRLPAVLNRHFPGYAECGLLIKIIRAGDRK